MVKASPTGQGQNQTIVTGKCLKPGCGKGLGDSSKFGFCGSGCKKSSTITPGICLLNGCSKNTHDGSDFACCCKAHHQKLISGGGGGSGVGGGSGGGPTCQIPGCGKPCFAGSNFCSKGCVAKGGGGGGGGGSGSTSGGGPTCQIPLCGKPCYAGSNFCSNGCRAAGGGKGGGKTGSSSSANIVVASVKGPSFERVQLDPKDPEYKDIAKYFNDKWDKAKKTATPIRQIWKVTSSDAEGHFRKKCASIGGDEKGVKVHGRGKNPGNTQRRFHGTRITCDFTKADCHDKDCSACGIMNKGFDLGKLGSWSGNQGFYGAGLYFTSLSSTSKGYGMKPGHSFQLGNWHQADAGNAVFVCRVACGISENYPDWNPKDKRHYPLDNNKFHSRFIDKSGGADELVVFEADLTCVAYAILF